MKTNELGRPFTRQEAFDIASKALLAQGVKSQGRDGSCLYRGPNNTRCAIGHLIPDDEYQAEWDDGEKLEVSTLARKDAEFFYALQRVHDRYEPKDWPARLESLAAVWELNK